MLKWTSESIVAGVAIAISTAGGLATTAIHWGSVNNQVETVQVRLNDHDRKLEAISADAMEQKIHNAKVEQSLDDVISRLDRMEKDIHASSRPAH